MTRRTALIVPVPEAEAAVRELRAKYDWSAARGVPAHVTILFPFVPADEVDEAAIAEVLSAHPAFEFELASVEHFGEEVTYLAPVPAEPFFELTRAVEVRWPDYPPYEGAYADDLVPHLTVAERPMELDVVLPIACRAHEVWLIEEEEPNGRWVRRTSFVLT